LSVSTRAGLFIVSVLVYVACLVSLIFWGNRRQAAIRAETSPETLPWRPRFRSQSPAAAQVYGGLAGLIFGGMAWLVVFGIIAHDWITAALTLAVSAGIWAHESRAAIRNIEKYWAIATRAVALLFAALLLIVN